MVILAKVKHHMRYLINPRSESLQSLKKNNLKNLNITEDNFLPLPESHSKSKFLSIIAIFFARSVRLIRTKEFRVPFRFKVILFTP